MKTGASPERAGSLVIELAARTAIVDGRRVKLPPTEFSLLVVLAARPGSVVSHKELLTEAFGDNSYMTSQELYGRIWNLRKLLGDHDREQMLVGNRRGLGYALELPRTAVEIIDEVVAIPRNAETEVIRLDDTATEPDAETPVPAVSADGGADTMIAVEDEAADGPERQQVPRVPIRMGTIVAALLAAALAFGGSWFAGYRLSQRDRATRQDAISGRQIDRDSTQAGQPDKKRPGTSKRDGEKRGGSHRESTTTVAAGTSSGPSSQDPATTTEQNGGSTSGDDNTEPNPPARPRPKTQLYHLFDPDTGDHFMTTSTGVADQKEAAGYDASVEGLVFTRQEKGTVAIGLDGGTAYVYRDARSGPRGVSVAALYRLARDDDFFYTTSSSVANQAQAQGWARSTAGYVGT